MAHLYHMIINKYIINNAKCHKLLSSDGITSRDLVIEKVTGIIEGIRLNTKSEVSVLPNIAKTAGIAKNLDEYQYIVCSEVGDIPDANSHKRELQKYRIAIIASFVKLVPLLRTLSSDEDLKRWNSFANILLTETSETVVKARTNQKEVRKSYSNNIRLKEALDFFGVPEKEIDHELESMYFAS